jgi:hypothetical protein
MKNKKNQKSFFLMFFLAPLGLDAILEYWKTTAAQQAPPAPPTNQPQWALSSELVSLRPLTTTFCRLTRLAEIGPKGDVTEVTLQHRRLP